MPAIGQRDKQPEFMSIHISTYVASTSYLPNRRYCQKRNKRLRIYHFTSRAVLLKLAPSLSNGRFATLSPFYEVICTITTIKNTIFPSSRSSTTPLLTIALNADTTTTTSKHTHL